MVSLKSITTFFYINAFLVSLSAFTYITRTFFISQLISNTSLMVFIHYGTVHKKRIHVSQKNYTLKDYLYLLSSTLLQSITESIVQHHCKSSHGTIYFLFYLFVFELLLDLFHYTAHRTLHTFPILYPIHKTHHHYAQPQLLNTYYHSPIDLVLVDCLPTMISMYILKGVFSSFQIQMVLVYKSFIEISGHSGKYVAPSSCFPLCVWLPRILGIELYTEDHDYHHSGNCKCNYSKRFKLWDRVFGTFKDIR